MKILLTIGIRTGSPGQLGHLFGPGHWVTSTHQASCDALLLANPLLAC